MEKDRFYIPETISDEAKAVLKTFKASDRSAISAPAVDDLEGWAKLNALVDGLRHQMNDDVVKAYEPTIEKKKIGGVSVVDVKPKGWQDNGKVMVFIHGGAYTFYFAETTLFFPVPVAHEANIRVVSVEYSLAPAAKWEQIVNECYSVLTALMSEYGAENVVLAGLSAGGGLAGGLIHKLNDNNQPLPNSLVLISPWSDITETGDSYQTLKEAEPLYLYDKILKPCADAYAKPEDQKHPYISPVYGDFSKCFPPTLIQGGTKESFLSNFVRLYQKIESSGGSAKLDLYEGMWHVFQEFWHFPESKEARRKITDFLKTQLNYEG
jgi:acetyl esterase/lipase